jgi:cytochrome c biogenesis protein CcmG, thiol:disulfide interchange protein DsbE
MPSATTPSSRRSWLIGAAAWAAVGGAVAQTSIGQRLPGLALRASDDLPVLVEGGPWKATYVDFWASWCTPCKLSFPWMNQMHDSLAASGLRIVAVNLDRREADARRFLQQLPARFAVAMDPASDSARLLDIKSMPSSFLVAPDRRLIYQHRGFRLEDRADLEQRLRHALA